MLTVRSIAAVTVIGFTCWCAANASLDMVTALAVASGGMAVWALATLGLASLAASAIRVFLSR